MTRRRYAAHPRITVPEVTGWLEMVESGAFPACAEQVALCAYVRRVFAEERLWVDRERLRTFKGYAPKYFGFDLDPEQLMVLALALCTFAEDGMPRWDTVLLYVGRGWGKTTFSAFLAFCLMSPAMGVPEYDVDICATTTEQAKIAYSDLYNLFEGDERRFSQWWTWNKVELRNKQTRSRFKYWSGNSASKDGMRSGCVLFDEVHAYQDTASLEVFTGGLGKKPEPRRIMTTTDGEVRDGPLDEYKAKGRKVLFDGAPDDGLLPFMCKLDDPSEIEDESAWPKANPRVARSAVLRSRYRSDVADWRESPAKHPMVPTKRFNLPEARRDIAVTSWERIERASREFDLDLVRGRPCVAGIDYARTTDMVGACLLFKDGEDRLVVPHAWWCSQSFDAGQVKAPLREWEAAGLLTVTDGVEVAPEDVARWVADTASSLGSVVECCAIDSYRFALMRRALAAVGLEPSGPVDERQVYLTRPSDLMRVQPIVDSAFANGKIAWGDNPLMRWATNNAKLVPAPNNNLTYGKVEPHGRKTDPFMALVHAFTVEDRIPEPVEWQAPMFITF